MVPFDLTSKGSAENMCLSTEIIISSAEKMSVGILETRFSQKCYPTS
jgi:hypothetical protein